jgi:RecJ-like exonuclease
MKHTITITLYDEDDEEVQHELPAVNEVCNRCQGYGSHTNPNIDGNGITQSEWAEWGQDEKEAYLNGEYDVSCEECHGNKVVQVVDQEACTPAQKKLFEEWEELENERASLDAADRAYARMECGYY